ncbi:thermonuclease family protein [Rhizobium sp. 1399]|uniref:thermonuclease family protein n=1 Tax=Rhizobium sp. 1399 TaxID=2817758 RepID=UPI00285A4649|nr:thermonuclease family protein [Rhizobium sp. 1399]MDR6671246.1 endonuclease YncB(thermonuclease family) [Rhizobium sp. 1399]
MKGSNLTVRLFGIETCGLDQKAHYQNVAWPCGIVAAGWLTQLTLGYEIKCLEEGQAGYAAIYGRCYLPSGEDIAKLALEQGMALAARQNGQPIVNAYGLIEEKARSSQTGIWSSNFVHGGVLYRAGEY